MATAGSLRYKLRIKPNRLCYYAKRYGTEGDAGLVPFHGLAKQQGHLTGAQLFAICHWKSRRGAGWARLNSEALVREITTFAFGAQLDEARLGALTLLAGVSYPTASVILHACLDSTYPILDYRALWSLGIEKPSAYTLPFWREYVRVCRAVAAEHHLSVRELDKALWRYSSEHQPVAGKQHLRTRSAGGRR